MTCPARLYISSLHGIPWYGISSTLGVAWMCHFRADFSAMLLQDEGYEPATLGMLPARAAAAQQQRSKQQRQDSKRRSPASSEDEDGNRRDNGLSSSDESDIDGDATPPAAAPGRLRAGRGQPGPQEKKAKVLDKLSLADQEALALQLLLGKR